MRQEVIKKFNKKLPQENPVPDLVDDSQSLCKTGALEIGVVIGANFRNARDTLAQVIRQAADISNAFFRQHIDPSLQDRNDNRLHGKKGDSGNA
ncbi:MAG TPA: hypothetical protein VKA18_14495 [Alphaproteobacteria bacterium]|nr:hypothetical protein [Alphaproteobacteria bacterium]